MISRRSLLALCPMWLLALLPFHKSQAAVTPLPVKYEALPKRQFVSTDPIGVLLEIAAARIVAWMQQVSYAPAPLTVYKCVPHFVRRTELPPANALARYADLPPIDLQKIISVIDGAPHDGVHVIRDLCKHVLFSFQHGPAVTSDEIEPGVNHAVRYVTTRYNLDTDMMLHSQYADKCLAFLVTALVRDLLEAPNRATARWLETDFFVKREAFLLEIVGHTCHLVDGAR